MSRSSFTRWLALAALLACGPLARLAVDQAARGQGLARQLLRFVFQLALRMARDHGCVGVAVDAKPDAVDLYKQYGFVSVDVVEGESDARPAPPPMFLAIRSIQEALGPKGG